MNILAFDLANFSSSLALIKQGKLVFSERSEEFRGQDVVLLPKLQKILRSYNLSFQDMDRIVTTTGPGSFTGIRVALSTAQGLSFASGVPALGVNSFEWVLKTYPKPIFSSGNIPIQFSKNHSLKEDGYILVLLESLRLELYGQLFNQDYEVMGIPFSLSPEAIAKNPLYKDAFCIGNGSKYMVPYGFVVDEFMPEASHLAEFSLTIPEREFKNYPCLPVYVREADTTITKKK